MSERPPRAGTFKKITSLANPFVKDIRALQLKKHRDETGLFIAEGQKLVRDAADRGWPIEMLAYSAALAGDTAIGSLAAETKESGGAVLEVSLQVLEKITRRDNPQNVIGVFRQRFGSAASIGREGIWVALDRVRDPGNLGTIVRTADAAGLAGVALIGAHCDPFSLEAVRATMGSIFNIPLVSTSEDKLISEARRHNARLIGTHLSAATVDFRQADYSQLLILLMGNEQHGLTEKLSAACDTLVRIPMRDHADSLNLAVSTGLMIYEALRHRQF
jgi:TrmH family RNA methyltransferase